MDVRMHYTEHRQWQVHAAVPLQEHRKSYRTEFCCECKRPPSSKNADALPHTTSQCACMPEKIAG